MTVPEPAAPTAAIVIAGVRFPLPIATGALELANRGRLQQLVSMGMPPRAARAIVKGRPFGSLADLARARGVGRATIGQLRAIVEHEASRFDDELVMRLWSLAFNAMQQAERVQPLDPARARRRHTTARVLYALQDALAREDGAALNKMSRAAWSTTTELRPAWIDQPSTYAESSRRFLLLVASTLRVVRQHLEEGDDGAAVRDGAIWALANALLFAFRPGPLTLGVDECFERLDEAFRRDLAAWPADAKRTARRAMKAVGMDARHLRAL